MGKIFYLMGKSSSGKDTIFKELKKRMTFLHTVTIYTTRPMREQERDGEEYFFVGEETLENSQAFPPTQKSTILHPFHAPAWVSSYKS